MDDNDLCKIKRTNVLLLKGMEKEDASRRVATVPWDTSARHREASLGESGPYSNIFRRPSSGRKVFSSGLHSGLPKGICAVSFHDAGNFHSRATASSMSGL